MVIKTSDRLINLTDTKYFEMLKHQTTPAQHDCDKQSLQTHSLAF